jgi:hypothetical protein
MDNFPATTLAVVAKLTPQWLRKVFLTLDPQPLIDGAWCRV